MNAIRVCVAEREERQRIEMVNKLSKEANIMIVGSTGNGMEALRMVTEQNPDVLISNLILPICDGYAILDQLQAMEKKPRVIIASTLTMESAIQKAFAKGADEYLIKPADSKLLARKIYELAGRNDLICQNHLMTQSTQKAAAEKPVSEEDHTRQVISTLFLRIGLPAHLLGYRFAQEAVFKLVEDPMLMKNRTKVLYPEIAAMHHTSAFCVERAIRHVITLTWERGIAERYEREYGQSSRLHLPVDKPTSGEFIALLAEYIRPKHHSTAVHHEP
ncbi:MAG: response regulator [Clostridiales bacterium]|nr:response regulator [Clostridiales bacterium]